MKKICCVLCAVLFLFASCQVQDSIPDAEEKSVYKGIWFSYLDYQTYLLGLGKEAYEDKISEIFSNISEFGFNTVIFQVLPFSDAFYTSEVYPVSKMIDSSFDPFETALEYAKKSGLRIEAWINPLRACTDEEMSDFSNDIRIKKWYNDEGENSDKISLVNNRWYYNPSEEDVREYIFSGVREICEKYDIDGIHIDDYFYPTTDEGFDKNSYLKYGGEMSLSQFRTEAVNSLVSGIYNTVKSVDKNLTFGISPQGNIENCKNKLYADVEKWRSTPGYCDYIMPQLYYSFRQTVLPFDKALTAWRKIPENESVKLYIGLAAYKICGLYSYSTEEEKNDWETSDDMLARQVTYTRSVGVNDGICVFSYRNLFPEDDSVIIREKENLKKVLQEEK